ncbi:MAG: type II toxin-antitoxin system death-on-curing family toxin [Streptosporangiales bacterium]|nr:type II toxin-antitoxin system death-on-curing family toxin [Streptosporangiales bacterium]
MTVYLTPDEVRRLHDREVTASDLAGVREDLLEAAVMRCQTSAGGQDAFPNIHSKAAALFTALIRYHAFADGNKRTAVLATHTFYLFNGYFLAVEPEDIIALALAVAQGYTDEEDGEVTARLEGWAQPIKYPDDPALGI